MGNRASHGAFDPLPGTRQLRYHGTIERSHRFRWPLHEVTLIARGIKEAGKDSISFEPAGAGGRFGLVSVTMKRLAPTAHTGSEKWQLTLEGDAIRSSVGSPVFDRNAFAVFVGGGNHSAGTTSGGSHSSSSDGRNLSYKYSSW